MKVTLSIVLVLFFFSCTEQKKSQFFHDCKCYQSITYSPAGDPRHVLSINLPDTYENVIDQSVEGVSYGITANKISDPDVILSVNLFYSESDTFDFKNEWKDLRDAMNGDYIYGEGKVNINDAQAYWLTADQDGSKIFFLFAPGYKKNYDYSFALKVPPRENLEQRVCELESAIFSLKRE